MIFTFVSFLVGFVAGTLFSSDPISIQTTDELLPDKAEAFVVVVKNKTKGCLKHVSPIIHFWILTFAIVRLYLRKYAVVIEDTLALRFSKVEEVDDTEDDTDTSDVPAPSDAPTTSDVPAPSDTPATTSENIAPSIPLFINSDRMMHILKTVYMDMKSPTKLDLSIKKPDETQQSNTQHNDTQPNDTQSDISYLDYLVESDTLNSDEGIDNSVDTGDSEVDNYVRNLIKSALRSQPDSSSSAFTYKSISDIPEDAREDIAKDITNNIARKILNDVQFASA